ncbi:IS3 family transposase [Nocardia vinacea]|uniref:IS3 family transposase n=1 Tax=Nocardia vinacea TaxID=96468 RepID=UPI0012F62640|nr:IS3 family transposase [Nocardia vinacea]
MGNFFSTLKTELVYRNSWRTREDAENALFSYIEKSHQRRMSSSSRIFGHSKGKRRVIGLAGYQAVVQFAEHGIEQSAQCGCMPLTAVSASSIERFPIFVVTDSSERPDISGGREAVVLGATSMHETGLA